MSRLLLMTIACLLILFGISGLWMMPKLIQLKIEQRMQLKIGTKPFDRFTKVPIPLTVKFYLFNVTNSERVLQGLERPQFQEVGPFMFKQWRRREVVDFEDYNRRLRYREYKTYYSMFQQQQQQQNEQQVATNKKQETTNSDNKLIINNQAILHNNNNNTAAAAAANDYKTAQNNRNNNYNINNNNQQQPIMLDPNNVNVTIINLPLLSVLTKLASIDERSLKRSLAAKVASRLIEDGRDKILVTRPVNELLFDGYKVDFLESARDLISETLGFNFESPLPRNKFGFFYMKNNTWTRKENGELTVYTGRNESMSDFMIVDNWNDQRQLSVWPSNTEAGNRCNQIRGTDGSQFHPGVTKAQVLDIFTPMACTSVYVKFKEETQTRDIPLLRFTTPPELFGAPKKYPQNACYCTISRPSEFKLINKSVNDNNGNRSTGAKSGGGGGITDSRCYLDGLMDLSLCQRGAPVAASAPHFYNADPMLAMAAGLKPNKEIHETYLDIEPMTGAVFRAASRAQLNAFVEQAALEVVDSKVIGHMTPMVAPLLWYEEAAEIDEKSSNDFKGQLLNTVLKARRSFIYSICIGILLAILVILQYWYVTCYKIDHDRAADKAAKSKKEEQQASKRRRSAASAADRKQLVNRGSLPGRRRRQQLDANLRLGGDASKSNLAAMQKPMLLVPSEPSSSSSSGLKALPVATMAATLLGAATAGKRNKRELADGAHDEDELSKRMLVNDEWEPAAATNTTSSSGRSSNGDGNGNSNRRLLRQDAMEASTSSSRSASDSNSPPDSNLQDGQTKNLVSSSSDDLSSVPSEIYRDDD